MRKTAATILILAVVWIGYTAWPIYDLLVLVRAIETRDVDAVTRHVYFDAVRASLTNQLVAGYVRRTGIQISPLVQSMAASALTDPVVKKLISAEALSELLSAGWPVTVVADPPAGTVGITRSTMGTIWQIFANSEYGIGRFEVSAPAVLPPLQRFRLTFRLLQWRWQLVAVVLPEAIQNLLSDELVKATRTRWRMLPLVPSRAVEEPEVPPEEREVPEELIISGTR